MFVPDLSSIKIPARPKTPSAEEIKAYCERIAEKLKKNCWFQVLGHYFAKDLILLYLLQTQLQNV